MPLTVNGTTISKLLVNGVEIKKLQVKRASDTTYTVVFEAGGQQYEGEFSYSYLLDLVNSCISSGGDLDQLAESLTQVGNEYSKGVVPLFKSGYMAISSKTMPDYPIDYSGSINLQGFDTPTYQPVENDTLSIGSTCELPYNEMRLGTLAIMKRLTPIISNLKSLLFCQLTTFDYSSNSYILNSNLIQGINTEDSLVYTIDINPDYSSLNCVDGEEYNTADGIKNFIDSVYFPEIDSIIGDQYHIRDLQPNTLLYEYLTNVSSDGGLTVTLEFSNPVTEHDLMVALSYITPINPRTASDFRGATLDNILNGLYAGLSGYYTISDIQNGTLITLTKSEHTTTNVPFNCPGTIKIYQFSLPDLQESLSSYDILVVNTGDELLNSNVYSSFDNIYQAPQWRIHYLTTRYTNYRDDIKDELQQRMDYITYLNRKINRSDIVTELGQVKGLDCISLGSNASFPLFLPDDYTGANNNYSIQDIITWEDYSEYYPLNSTLKFINNESNTTIAEIIQQYLQLGTLYPPETTSWGLSIEAVNSGTFHASYNNFEPNILYLTSYLFESTSDSYIKLLISNYLGYLVDSNDSYLIKKGSYSPQ